MKNAERPTLSDLQAATGSDLNSVSVNPKFNSLDDLHTMNIWLNGIANPGTGITTDID